MTTYESEVKTISSNEEVVFGILSDLNNLTAFKNNQALTEKVKELHFDTDSCSFVVEGFGRIGLRIIEREPFKTIKFSSENAPVQANFWIQLKHSSQSETLMKLTLKADIPMMIKMMVDKKLQTGINEIANVLANALSK
jgi:hypothetical protein